jgi:hypothetical protein
MEDNNFSSENSWGLYLMNLTASQISRIFTEFMNQTNKSSLNASEISTVLKKVMEDTTTGSHDTFEISNVLNSIIGGNKKSTLTAAEVSNLWTQFMGDSMSICVYKHFLSVVENKEIKSIMEFALSLSQNHVKQITEFFEGAQFQIPMGFKENDVNLDAPRLFSDHFMAQYTEIMTTHGLTAYSLAMTTSERKDIQEYFYNCIVEAKELFQRVNQFSQTQGTYSDCPTIPSSENVDFVEKAGIISNLFGKNRPLNVSEINNLYFNSKKSGFVRTLTLAFGQVAKSEDVRKYMMDGLELVNQDVKSMNTLLQDDNLRIPRSWDADITNSTESPFSDKLLMFHHLFLISAGISYYGAGVGSSMRSDINATYGEILKHILQAAMACQNTMVKHGWLEKQPQAVDRKALSKGIT